MSMFNHSLKVLNDELARLYDAMDILPPATAKKSKLYKRILELEAASNLLKKYDFKLKE